jgi:predicted RNase H-like HicB family nuclease
LSASAIVGPGVGSGGAGAAGAWPLPCAGGCAAAIGAVVIESVRRAVALSLMSVLMRHSLRDQFVHWRVGQFVNGRDAGEAYDEAMDLNLTAVFQKVPEGYIGFVEEVPGANTQAATLEEARANLQEAVALVLEANRELVHATTQGREVIREPLKVGA